MPAIVRARCAAQLTLRFARRWPDMRLVELSHPIVSGMVTVPNLPPPTIDEFLTLKTYAMLD